MAYQMCGGILVMGQKEIIQLKIETFYLLSTLNRKSGERDRKLLLRFYDFFHHCDKNQANLLTGACKTTQDAYTRAYNLPCVTLPDPNTCACIPIHLICQWIPGYAWDCGGGGSFSFLIC